jgi:hypothetical protein
MKKQAHTLLIKRIILSSLLVIILGCNSNDEHTAQANELLENKSDKQQSEIETCMFTTKNNPKTGDLNMQIPYPCEWQSDNGQNENVIKKFRKINIDGSAIEEMLIVTDMKKNLSESQINKLLSEEILSEGMDLEKDKKISIERLLIDSNPSAKMVYETSLNDQENKIFSVIVQYIIVYKKYFIRLQFGTFGASAEKANNLYLEHEKLFNKIASETKLENIKN